MAGIEDILKKLKGKQFGRDMKARQQENMGDVEFQMEIAPQLNYRGEIDPAAFNLLQKRPGEKYNYQGLHNPQNTAEKVNIADDGRPPDYREIPAGSVNIVGVENTTPQILGHEYRHKQRKDGGSSQREIENRLMDAYNAQTVAEFRKAADGLERFTGMDTTELIQLLRQMGENKPEIVEVLDMEKDDWAKKERYPHQEQQPYLTENPLFERILTGR